MREEAAVQKEVAQTGSAQIPHAATLQCDRDREMEREKSAGREACELTFGCW
jgi:hypothetical protein